MAKDKFLGIEIGNNRIKIVAYSTGKIERFVTAELPDNLVIEDEIVCWEALAEFTAEIVKSENLKYKNVKLVLPEKLTYIQRLSLPLMSVEQLKVNLPYEFHDYITEDMEKYIYDYSVIDIKKDESGNPIELDLMAVATSKELIDNYKTMFRRAGLKLMLVAPEFAAFENIIEDIKAGNSQVVGDDFAILDLGHRMLRLHFFTDGEFEITRNMEPGCSEVTMAISDKLGMDIHIAQITKESNKDDVLNEPECLEIYNQMAIEIMRVLNFYNFNHPENTLDTLYYCGGGSLIKPLIESVEQMIDIKLISLYDVMQGNFEDRASLLTSAAAIGICFE